MDILNTINGWIWGLPLIVLLLGTGLFLTLRLRFVQFKGLFHALKLAFGKQEEGEGDINHFQALMTALSATVGTGNIVGVAMAITAGGPGALFWMWVTGLVGMATKYSEAVLAVKYRTKDEKGRMAGGPMYYIRDGLNLKWLGILFAVFASLAAFGIGNMTQSNAVKDAVIGLAPAGSVAPWMVGLVLSILTGVTIIGGIKGIGRVTGFLVPIMIVLYILGGGFILIRNAALIPDAFALILKEAFTARAGAGGLLGFFAAEAIRSGVARGIFSNESGLGSGPIAAAAARTNDPVTQALVSMTQTFIDTLIVCTITGLVIIISGVYLDPALKKNALTMAAFNKGFPGGSVIVSLGMVFFAFSTIIGWYYYGERSIAFLLGVKAILPYQTLWVIAVFIGTVLELKVVWTFSDIMNGLMAFPNLIALLGLSGVIVAETRRYFDARKG